MKTRIQFMQDKHRSLGGLVPERSRRAEDYVYSSAGDYAGAKGLLEIVVIE